MTGMKKVSELNDLLDQRQEIVGEIADLKNKQHSIEYKVKKQIIETGQIDLLNVNWGRVTRAHWNKYR